MRTRVLRVGVFSALAAGCYLGAGSFAGKACENNNDCPDPYACAQVRPGPRTCELIHGIDLGGAGGGTGGAGGGGVAAAPDYCHDAKPILDRTCVSNCHGVDNTGSGLPYRFDVYSLGGVDAGAPLGAFEMATPISARVTAGTMPPFGPNNPKPTSEERTILLRWVSTGAAQCFDAGSTAGPDAGTDGGKSDGGKADGG